MDANSKAALKTEAVAALSDPVRQKALMCKLLSSVYEDRGETPEAVFSCSMLFDLACAVSGTAVDVQEPKKSSPPCCVIICGYAGSSLRMLKKICNVYTERHPDWRIVTSTIPGLKGAEVKPQLDKQLASITHAVGSVPRIIGHVMSNMGHLLWVELLQHLPGLLPRLRGVVYDCSVSRNIYGADDRLEALGQSSDGPGVTVGTIWMAVLSEQLTAETADGSTLGYMDHKALRPPLEVAARAHAAEFRALGVQQINGENIFEWHARTEPPVPTVCISGETDTIIPPSHVDDWAALLLSLQPGRPVHVVHLKGAHVQVHLAEAERYPAAIEAMLTHAMDDDAAMRRTPAVAGSDEALRELLQGCELLHLQEPLATESLEACAAKLATGGRTVLIKHFKDVGVDKLADRQKLATAVAKAAKGGAG